jgi:S-DNA-T family DNA segregation ATPase FtsK/SpoIIIE
MVPAGPYGVTATEVIERREKLAAGLARPLGCVWPEGNADVHPGRLVLWVGDQDMADARKHAWPLLRTGTVDLFKPVPWGH